MQETVSPQPSLMDAFSKLNLNTDGQVLQMTTKTLSESGNPAIYLPTEERPDDRAIVEKLISLGFFSRVGEEQYKLSDAWLKEMGSVI